MTSEQAKETGPIYGVDLIDTLPLNGGIKQQMPSRADLEEIQQINDRVVAGYEVAIAHLAALQQRNDELTEAIEEMERKL